MPATSSSYHPKGLWVITSYFNPLGYRTRKENFKIFRERMHLPLLTVEQGVDGRFDLTEEDSTRLIQVSGSDLMWQKERLLNVALENLPDDCSAVAWIDCDVIFEREDWAELALNALERYELVQLFEEVVYLKRDADLQVPLRRQGLLNRQSVGFGHAKGTLDDNDLYSKSALIREQGVSSDFSNGFAWVMRREVLDMCKFYDASILGGGDYKFAQAALGFWKTVTRRHHLGDLESRYYARWAKKVHRLIQGRVGSISGNIYHLWHGDLNNRNYLKRHGTLRDHDFDPEVDIAINSDGCWSWNSEKLSLHEAVHQHFINRQEDGPPNVVDAQKVVGQKN